jgi:tetratricopeptide (TPR) repeat protein
MQQVATNTAATKRVRSLAIGSLALLALSALLALPTGAQQGNSSDSGSGQSSSTPSKQPDQQQPPAHKGAAQQNPFPADVSKHAAQQQNQPTDAPAAPAADQQAPQPAQQPGNAAKDNPFPEDVSKGAAAAAAAKDSDANGGSSSSSSSSNAGTDTDPNADLPRDTGRRKLRKPSGNDIQSGSLAGEGRAQDDVRVGRFYLGSGDYKGAYGRFSDAVRLDPASVDAIYGLAAAAAGLHHPDEALTNYKLYLEIAPDGNDARSARKAIRALSK